MPAQIAAVVLKFVLQKQFIRHKKHKFFYTKTISIKRLNPESSIFFYIRENNNLHQFFGRLLVKIHFSRPYATKKKRCSQRFFDKLPMVMYLLSVYRFHMADKFQYFIGVPPFVIIPAHNFYESRTDLNTCFFVKD